MIHNKDRFKYIIIFSALIINTGIYSAHATILTSIRPLGFIASAIAEGVIKTEILIPDGSSPHNYALKPSDIKRLHNADLVVWVGPEMETFLTKTIQQIDDTNNLMLANLPTIHKLLITGNKDYNLKTPTLTSTIQAICNKKEYKSFTKKNVIHTSHSSTKEHDKEYHGQYNLHIWLSPEIAKQIAIAIHAKLLLKHPNHKDILDVNLRRFEEQLKKTQKNIFMMLQPVKGKGYFVFHDAYGYFENTFGLTPLGHFTVNPEIQPGAQSLHQIKTQMVKPKAVFAEPQFRPAVIEAILQESKVCQGTLDPLGSTIALGADSYMKFLIHLSQQYLSCLSGD